jgi:hypothetical protein
MVILGATSMILLISTKQICSADMVPQWVGMGATITALTQIDSKFFPDFLQGNIWQYSHNILHINQTDLSMGCGAVVGESWREPSLHPLRQTGGITMSRCRIIKSDICMTSFI